MPENRQSRVDTRRRSEPHDLGVEVTLTECNLVDWGARAGQSSMCHWHVGRERESETSEGRLEHRLQRVVYVIVPRAYGQVTDMEEAKDDVWGRNGEQRQGEEREGGDDDGVL